MAGGKPDTPIQTQVVSGANRVPSSGGAKVTVACNLPHGIYLRAFEMVEEVEQVMGGGTRIMKVGRPVGEPIRINGVAHEIDKAPRAHMFFGYALTYGVDKDMWDNWFEANRNSHMVKNKCIFAYENKQDTKDACRDYEGTRSGMEPFLPDGDLRGPRPAQSSISTPVREEEQAQRAKVQKAIGV